MCSGIMKTGPCHKFLETLLLLQGGSGAVGLFVRWRTYLQYVDKRPRECLIIIFKKFDFFLQMESHDL